MARPPAIETETALWLALDISSLKLTDEQLVRFFSDNDDKYQFEVSAARELIIMFPAGLPSDEKNVIITTRLRLWTEQDSRGRCYGQSAMFTLSNGAKRSPDASWVHKSRLEQFEYDTLIFPRVSPDFVIELRSKTNRLKKIEEKMEEYMANGVQLGWLLDPLQNRATIYRPGRTPQVIENPTILSADPVLAGFTFDFREIL
jgi:Uma2 family endonuclease